MKLFIQTFAVDITQNFTHRGKNIGKQMSLVAQTPTNILHTVMEHRAGLTFSPHADFQALLQPTVLALVPVVLVDGAVSVPPAGVGEVSSH